MQTDNPEQVKTELSEAKAGPHKSWLRKAGEALLVCAITLAMILVLLEVGLRLFAPQYSSEMAEQVTIGLWTPDATAQYRNKPDVQTSYTNAEVGASYQTNSQGLREDHDIGAPADNTLRMLAIGDSFTFGWGVAANDTFVHKLSGSTTPNGKQLEVVNGGVIGYGTDNELGWLRTYGWALQPKVVLLGFFLGNDTHDNMLGLDKTYVDDKGDIQLSPALAAQDGTPAPTNQGFFGSVKNWLALNSDAYIFLRRIAHDAADWISPKPQVAREPTLTDTAPVYFASPSPDYQAGWDKTYALLDSMKSEVEAHGVQFIVVAIPAREQIEDSYWQDILTRFGLKASDVQRDKPNQLLTQWATRTNTQLIDLLPAFQAAPTSPQLYFTTDIHFNAAGHSLAAQTIRAALVKDGLLK